MQWGDSYNQHHGWALWALARHFLHTGDRDWFGITLSANRTYTFTLNSAATAGLIPYSRPATQGNWP